MFPSLASIDGLDIFDESIPSTGSDPRETLALLHKHGSPATVTTTGGRYFGFVNGALHPPALAAKWLVGAWDQNAALHVMSPITSKLEAVCEAWLVDLFKLPPGTAAGFVTGTSTSLICGIAAARSELLRRLQWDVGVKGLYGAPEIRVVLGDQAHGAVLRALALLGLGQARVERVATDAQGRMRPSALPELDERTLLVVQAGNVNSGSFDPMKELIDRAREADAWIHVDGAFGLWAAASKSTYPLYAGAEQADSWSVDAHKTLNAPYDCGIVLCRHREAFVLALQATGAYLQFSDHRDGMLYTPEMSRKARAIELWMTLKTLGKDGIESLVDQLCARAKLFAQRLEERDFRILNDVVFNQVLVAGDNEEQTRRTLLAYIQQSGECWCGGSTWNNEAVIRVSVCSWVTTPDDVERSVAAFVKGRAEALVA